MKKTFTLILLAIAPGLSTQAQTNTFPASGNAGIGITSPDARLHIRSEGASPWLALDKNPNEETGIQFRKSNSVLFYLYSDNTEDDALKIQSTGLSGEHDGSPRINIPYNSKNLYFAQSGGNVGIGTNSPTLGRLQVTQLSDASDQGLAVLNSTGVRAMRLWTDADNSYVYSGATGQANLILNNTANVGIGNTSPQAKLHISNGDLLLQNPSSGYPVLWLKNVSGNNSIRVDYNSIIGSGSNLFIRSGSTTALVLNDVGGNVGIGTSSPNEKLTVNGTIYGKEVKVDLNVPGPDYVFENGYNLPSLEEIKSYIDQHKHLPEVPSAREMETNGINVGEMNMILLKKVEELTLYLIEVKKEILELRIENKELKESIHK